MKNENYLLQVTPIEDIEGIMYKKDAEGWRLVQMHANRTKDGYELFYSVGKDMEFETYKVILEENATVHSISTIFPSAMLYENEIKELIGINIKYINKDYNNHFYRIAKETPYK